MTEHHSGDSGGGAFARIPGWDGNPNTWWRYKQDVELWLEGEDLEVKYSVAARMVQKLTGTARIRANLLDVRHLRPQRPVARVPAVVDSDGNEITAEVPAVLADWRAGIDYLLEDLEKMPGIPKVVRKGAQRSWFYESLTRRPGETMANWLTRFRAGLKRCADEGVKMDNQEDLGWWLVKKSLLSKERKERLLARLTTDYDYAEVEREMLAIFTDIHVGEGRPQPPGPRPRPRQANVTETGSEASEGSRERSDDVGSDSGSTTADPEPGRWRRPWSANSPHLQRSSKTAQTTMSWRRSTPRRSRCKRRSSPCARASEKSKRLRRTATTLRRDADAHHHHTLSLGGLGRLLRPGLAGTSKSARTTATARTAARRGTGAATRSASTTRGLAKTKAGWR